MMSFVRLHIQYFRFLNYLKSYCQNGLGFIFGTFLVKLKLYI